MCGGGENRTLVQSDSIDQSFTGLVRVLTPLEQTVVVVRLGYYAILGTGFLRNGPPLSFMTTKKTFHFFSITRE